MLKKIFPLVDLDGNPFEEEWFFNLSQLEINELNAQFDGDVSAYLAKLVEAKDYVKMMVAYKTIVGKTVGRRSADNRRLDKSDEITMEFLRSQAGDDFLSELFVNPAKLAEFLRSLAPEGLKDKVEAATKDPEGAYQRLLGELKGATPVLAIEDEWAAALEKPIEEPKPMKITDYAHVELVNMPYDEFMALMPKKIPAGFPQSILRLAIQRRQTKE